MLRVTHVGPSSQLNGGIASAIRTYEDNRLVFLERGYQLSFIKTTPFHSPASYFKFFLATLPRGIVNFATTDIVHFHTASNGSFFRKFLLFNISLLLRKKNIVHLHGGGFFDFLEKSSSPVREYILSFLNKANAIIVVSTEFEKRTKLLVGNTVPIIIVPNSSEEFELAARDKHREQNQGYILFAGSLAKHKGLEDLIKALSLLKSQGLPTKLVVIGSGDLTKWKQICTHYGVDELVYFKGWVSGEEKIRIYQGAELFCLPSHIESFGISALEAMLSSKPLVCTKLGGFLDLVAHGENGYLAAPNSPEELSIYIGKILNNKNLAKNMGENGFNKAMNSFTTQASIEKTISAYNVTRLNITPKNSHQW